MRKTLLAAVAIGLALNCGARADAPAVFMNAEQLRNSCSAPSHAERAPCIAYIEGIADALSDDGMPAGLRICIDPGRSTAAIEEVIDRLKSGRRLAGSEQFDLAHTQAHLMVGGYLIAQFWCHHE